MVVTMLLFLNYPKWRRRWCCTSFKTLPKNQQQRDNKQKKSLSIYLNLFSPQFLRAPDHQRLSRGVRPAGQAAPFSVPEPVPVPVPGRAAGALRLRALPRIPPGAQL